MKRFRFHLSLIFSIVCIFLLTVTSTAYATEDWHQEEIPGYSEETTNVMGYTTDGDGNVYLVYSVYDPTGAIMPFPMATMYDGESWTALGTDFIAEISGGQCKVRYDVESGRLYVGLITINGVIHIYEFIDGAWVELPYIGRLLRIDSQYIYYDFQVMPDGTLIVAYVDIEEEGGITAKVYEEEENQWLTIGDHGFTDDPANYISLAIDSVNSNIYAGVIVDRTVIEVWRYSEDGKWELTDNSGMEAVYPYWVRMIMSGGEKPMLVYMDAEVEWKTFAMIYDEDTWKYLEPYPFSPPIIRTYEMMLDSSGFPVVYFNDNEYENGITSMRHNGEVWEYIGRRGFTPAGTNVLLAGFDSEDVPFVLFPDVESGQLLKMVYGEYEETSVMPDEEEEPEEKEEDVAVITEEKDTAAIPEVAAEDVAEGNDGVSILTIIIAITVSLLVILLILFFLTKRRKDEEDKW